MREEAEAKARAVREAMVAERAAQEEARRAAKEAKMQARREVEEAGSARLAAAEAEAARRVEEAVANGGSESAKPDLREPGGCGGDAGGISPGIDGGGSSRHDGQKHIVLQCNLRRKQRLDASVRVNILIESNDVFLAYLSGIRPRCLQPFLQRFPLFQRLRNNPLFWRPMGLEHLHLL